MKIASLISLGLVLLLAQVSPAQDDVITGFTGNGFITWTNSHTNGQFNVEWASVPEGPWHASWTSLWNFAATADTIRASVPMFYRVSWSTNEMHDLRISPSEAWIGFDGNLVALSAAGGDGTYQWSVYDVALGEIDHSTGTSVLYERAYKGENAVSVESDGRRAYSIIPQP